MKGRLYRGRARWEECTNQGHEGKNVLIIGHEGKNVQREGKEGRMYLS